MIIRFKKLHPSAQAPKRANTGDAGADLYSVEDAVIAPLTRQLIHTGISLELNDNNIYARIAPRSGLASKYGIDVMAGVVDSGYRGELCIMLFNSDKEQPFNIKAGDRIAQLIIEKCYPATFIESNELTDSDRSIKGFGSSGIK